MISDSEKSGQLFSSDFLVAVLVFLFIMTAVQVQHSIILGKIENQHNHLYRETLISRTDTLVMFSGQPEGWNESTVEVLGLSTGEPNHINETSLQRFIQMDMYKAKRLLGLRERSFYFSVENSTGNVLSGGGVQYDKGADNWGDAEDIYTVRRNVFLGQQGEAAIMRLVVW